MRLLSASALWWLLLGAIIIFFYLLKLKRQRRVVPSVLLWQRALAEVEANAPFKKLRRSLLLLLQLAALAALVFALARPLIQMRSLASGSTIIVIDSTASMSARDEGTHSRLERARELARDMVAGLGGGDRAAVIESSSRVTVRSGLTADHAALTAAINDIQETDAAGSLTDAVRLAEQIARTERDAGIVVLSDGASPQLASDLGASSDGARHVALRFVRVGQRAQNVGIVAMNARPVAASARQELFASVANFGDRDESLGAELRIDGKLADARTINVKANERAALVFDALPEAGGLAELKLNIADDLAADNIAYAYLPDARRPRLAVISDNPFLLQAIAANDAIDARKVSSDAPLASFDCVITDGAVPAGVIEWGGPLLALNPTDVAGWWHATGTIERPEITSIDRAHPVNSYLSYADVHLESATRREAAAWLRPVVSAAGDGLILAGQERSRRVVMIGFDLTQSDLPLKVEFPILLANAVAWLAGRDAQATERAVRTGQSIVIRTTQSNLTINLPGGDEQTITARDGVMAFADTLRAGIYQVKDAPPVAASLLSESESDTAPRDSIKTRAGEVSGQVETFKTEREAWRWLALAVLAVLSFEWWVYHKRIAA
jgi:von Willebrand factor type A domain/Aerotolerance regulator N-terminal